MGLVCVPYLAFELVFTRFIPFFFIDVHKKVIVFCLSFAFFKHCFFSFYFGSYGTDLDETW